MRSSLKSYRKVSLDSEISVASPHRIVQMMFAGGLERLAQSRYAIENKNMSDKGVFIGKAIGIVNGLNNSLNMDAGGEIAGNLSQLYDFIIMKATEANLNNDVQAIDDAVSVLRTLKEGWDAIPQDQHHLTSEAS
ncbi:flagellar export chaperone FliS [Shewanella metallivivens]|uniref:Flagellar secretion chaperone FliS n=1 Tax=Shewanella metallivivens TaxID=2872342 RepID=A0ABT5TJ31_9GAMM|nr:flagellar export chaperone FliS [Shewanella metallivivens]MDD8058615.1 flagellar export chaperone FliS [Shewanella metallivivens]